MQLKVTATPVVISPTRIDWNLKEWTEWDYSLRSPLEDTAAKYTKLMVETKDELVRKSLIALGWTPPKEGSSPETSPEALGGDLPLSPHPTPHPTGETSTQELTDGPRTIWTVWDKSEYHPTVLGFFSSKEKAEEFKKHYKEKFQAYGTNPVIEWTVLDEWD